MRTIILLALVSSIHYSVSAQNKENSLQASLNNALAKQTTPIKNLQANIDLSKKAVQIKWESTPSTSANQFIIEKSADKLNWEVVATVYGAPHKEQSNEYFHLDYNPIENMSYYRIVEKNNSTDVSYSNIVPVSYIKTESITAGMNLNPDFSEGQKIINIAFEEIFEKEILLVIRDKNGNEYYSKVIINIENESLVAVPIENEVPKGDYLITATSENQIYSQNITVN